MKRSIRVGDLVDVFRLSAETAMGDIRSWIGGYRVTAVGFWSVEVEQTSGPHAGRRWCAEHAHVRHPPAALPEQTGPCGVSSGIMAMSNAMEAATAGMMGAADSRRRRPNRRR